MLLNQQDHSWNIWVLLSFTTGGHDMENLNPKPYAFLLNMARF
jgi:hypothetical protein